ncbi:hypothetical protein LEP1GSC008_1694 [Leptospira kirschneri serovar Bulgarica str. Nikolaevo]|uniref:Uncharacterized protein n=1 Tax=Leptospira kirschneri serovar Bulgarica str. Nikolaevo TaxID=1240687 RepID=M6F5R0_9LEPT|nr:hypothetical protein LEP1GSC008_1694 [Leptospira kirschneri serovar Bulgarica str. Nikolaevo]
MGFLEFSFINDRIENCNSSHIFRMILDNERMWCLNSFLLISPNEKKHW